MHCHLLILLHKCAEIFNLKKYGESTQRTMFTVRDQPLLQFVNNKHKSRPRWAEAEGFQRDARLRMQEIFLKQSQLCSMRTTSLKIVQKSIHPTKHLANKMPNVPLTTDTFCSAIFMQQNELKSGVRSYKKITGTNKSDDFEWYSFNWR